jgi:hypothetical protein
MGLGTKTYWLTDRQSQCDFDFDFDLVESQVVYEISKERTSVGGKGIAIVGAVIRKRLVTG